MTGKSWLRARSCMKMSRRKAKWYMKQEPCYDEVLVVVREAVYEVGVV